MNISEAPFLCKHGAFLFFCEIIHSIRKSSKFNTDDYQTSFRIFCFVTACWLYAKDTKSYY